MLKIKSMIHVKIYCLMHGTLNMTNILCDWPKHINLHVYMMELLFFLIEKSR